MLFKVNLLIMLSYVPKHKLHLYMCVRVCLCVNSLGDQMGRALASSVEGRELIQTPVRTRT